MKDLIDEIIFRTVNPRNRIMLELMAKGGMRIGEVLKLRLIDVKDRKITLPDPKSGKGSEIVPFWQVFSRILISYIRLFRYYGQPLFHDGKTLLQLFIRDNIGGHIGGQIYD